MAANPSRGSNNGAPSHQVSIRVRARYTRSRVYASVYNTLRLDTVTRPEGRGGLISCHLARLATDKDSVGCALLRLHLAGASWQQSWRDWTGDRKQGVGEGRTGGWAGGRMLTLWLPFSSLRADPVSATPPGASMTRSPSVCARSPACRGHNSLLSGPPVNSPRLTTSSARPGVRHPVARVAISGRCGWVEGNSTARSVADAASISVCGQRLLVGLLVARLGAGGRFEKRPLVD